MSTHMVQSAGTVTGSQRWKRHSFRPYILVKIDEESDDFNMLSVKLQAAQDTTLSNVKEIPTQTASQRWMKKGCLEKLTPSQIFIIIDTFSKDDNLKEKHFHFAKIC